jgi:iron complex outermembrane receptor protein
MSGVLSASYAWQDRIYFDIFNNPGMSEGAYGLINLSAGLQTQDEHWQWAAFVTNLTDHFYINGKSVQPVGPVPIPVSEVGTPRMYGVSVQYRF